MNNNKKCKLGKNQIKKMKAKKKKNERKTMDHDER